MFLITREEVAELHKVQQDNCISIFIPTHRAGKKVLQEEDAIALKNQLKEVKAKLKENGLRQEEIDQRIAPIQDLVEDSSFWRDQSDGLAVYVADNMVKTLTLPIDFSAYNYVGDRFYLSPLMPMFHGDGQYYLLWLERRNVKLYECTQHTFAEIVIDDLIPSSKRDEVGFDYEEKNLQFRAGSVGTGHALYHGQEAATGKRKNEIKKYLRAIHNGIRPIIQENNFPMLVVSQDFMFDIYKGENTYNNLLEENLTTDFSDTDIFDVHERAWEIVAPIFDKARREHIAKFKDQEGTGKTAIGIGKILPAAIEGKIDALFCEKGTDIMGTYTQENDNIAVEQDEDQKGISLMDIAATQTFLKGGTVYITDKDNMPNPNSRINALYRY